MEKRKKKELRVVLRNDLVNLLDGIWLKTESLTLVEMAKKSDLHISTVTRLYYGAFQFPRFETIQKLASAAGYDLTLAKSGHVTATTSDEKELARG